MTADLLTVIQGDCTDWLPTIETASVDAIITDPPYPEIDRDYGRLSESEWWDLMMVVCRESRRILKPTGSAVFILQPNSKKAGSVRSWLFDFQSWACREWNIVQDVWWWNYVTMPSGGIGRDIGLLRPSVKACVWLGSPDCYRSQSDVLWDEAKHHAGQQAAKRFERQKYPSGREMNPGRCFEIVKERGGVTPFNLLPIANNNNCDSGGLLGHGASTPTELCSWWIRYICPPAGTVLDMFAGTGTTGKAALELGRRAILIEKTPGDIAKIERRCQVTLGLPI